MYEDVVREIIGDNAIDRAMVEAQEVLAKECVGCLRIRPNSMFQKDSSCRDGRRDLCDECATSPRLSTEEHVCRLREMTYGSEAVKRQRWQHQEDYRNDLARVGHPMWTHDLMNKLKQLVPSLYVIDGRIVGDLAVYRTYGCPQPRLEGRDFEYLFYVPTGVVVDGAFKPTPLPEYSIYEFNDRDVPVRERIRGWRTVLLRLIKSGLLTEEKSNEVFGYADGPASTVWKRTLYLHRNRPQLNKEA